MGICCVRAVKLWTYQIVQRVTCRVPLKNKRANAVEKIVERMYPIVYCPELQCQEKISEPNVDNHILERKHKISERVLTNNEPYKGTYVNFKSVNFFHRYFYELGDGKV